MENTEQVAEQNSDLHFDSLESGDDDNSNTAAATVLVSDEKDDVKDTTSSSLSSEEHVNEQHDSPSASPVVAPSDEIGYNDVLEQQTEENEDEPPLEQGTRDEDPQLESAEEEEKDDEETRVEEASTTKEEEQSVEVAAEPPVDVVEDDVVATQSVEEEPQEQPQQHQDEVKEEEEEEEEEEIEKENCLNVSKVQQAAPKKASSKGSKGTKQHIPAVSPPAKTRGRKPEPVTTPSSTRKKTKEFKPTVVKPFNFSTTNRLEQRHKYDERRRRQEQAQQEKERRLQERREREEAEALKEYRRSLVIKARPIQYYTPITVSPSNKPPTLPTAPILSTLNRSRTADKAGVSSPSPTLSSQNSASQHPVQIL